MILPCNSEPIGTAMHFASSRWSKVHVRTTEIYDYSTQTKAALLNRLIHDCSNKKNLYGASIVVAQELVINAFYCGKYRVVKTCAVSV